MKCNQDLEVCPSGLDFTVNESLFGLCHRKPGNYFPETFSNTHGLHHFQFIGALNTILEVAIFHKDEERHYSVQDDYDKNGCQKRFI